MNIINSILRFFQDHPTPQGQKLYFAAMNALGTDASPNDLAPDELGCMETVTTIGQGVFADIPILLSTTQGISYLRTSDKWVEVGTPIAGDLLISPTGEGGQNGITHGHTGYIIANGLQGVLIASNDSATGKFLQNYTWATWRSRWVDLGGYKMHLFRRIKD